MRYLVSALVLIAGMADRSLAGFDDGMAAYHGEDYAVVLREFRPLAEGGDARAQYRLGIMYNMGFGVAQNSQTAAAWLTKAAERNVPDAQFVLGVLYELGRGVPHSMADAVSWWRRAAALGSLDALHKLSDHGFIPEPSMRLGD